MRFSYNKFKIYWLKIRLNLMISSLLLWESVSLLTSVILIKISTKWNKYHLQVIFFSTLKNLRLIGTHTENKCLNKPDKIKWNNKNNKINRIHQVLLLVMRFVLQSIFHSVLVHLKTDLFIFVLIFHTFSIKIFFKWTIYTLIEEINLNKGQLK